jgi:hypothetical protein
VEWCPIPKTSLLLLHTKQPSHKHMAYETRPKIIHPKHKKGKTQIMIPISTLDPTKMCCPCLAQPPSCHKWLFFPFLIWSVAKCFFSNLLSIEVTAPFIVGTIYTSFCAPISSLLDLLTKKFTCNTQCTIIKTSRIFNYLAIFNYLDIGVCNRFSQQETISTSKICHLHQLLRIDVFKYLEMLPVM